MKVNFMTRKIGPLLIISSIFFFLMSCSQEPNQEPWIPALEETSFIYLADTVDKVLKVTDETAADIHSGNSRRALDSLAATRHTLLKIKLYDIPMTEFRQLVYDADRLYFLGRKDQAKKNLKNGKKILLGIVDALGSPAKASINEIIQYVEELDVALDHSPEKVGEILKTLGERVNLLLLKGDLVLAGTVFKTEL
jgi:hypothetical protein